MDALNESFTVVEYALWCQGQRVTRFKRNGDANVNQSVYNTCNKETSGNWIVIKLPTTTIVIKEGEGRFVEMLDLSRKYLNEYNLINTSKFGTFWWVLSHEIKNIIS